MSATVIVPSWNGAQRLQRLLPTLGTDSEVVVVDNGSTDATADLLARRFPQVEIMRLARNHGFSKAVNRGAEVASSDAIVLVNDDCVCEQGFAERLARALDPASGVPMAAGVLLEARDPGVDRLALVPAEVDDGELRPGFGHETSSSVAWAGLMAMSPSRRRASTAAPGPAPG